MASFCSECGAPLEPGAHFCAECAHPVAGAAAATETPAPEKLPVAEAEAGAAADAGSAAAASPAAGATSPGGTRSRRWIALAVVLALVGGGVAAALVLSSNDEARADKITLEPADSDGANPFTDSSETEPPPSSTDSTVPNPPPLDTTAQGTTVSGGAAGLYGGTLNEGACDVEAQIKFLQQNADKAAAFAGVLGITVEQIPSYLRSLTPVILRYDTRVTNHGYFDGSATSRQAVLQAGTAVLVDVRGIPRVRCKCGNPLTPPLDLADKVTYYGDQWDGFSLGDTRIIIENNIDIDIFVIVDFDLDILIDRDAGDSGDSDTTHDGGGGTKRLVCPSTPDQAVANTLKARRADDKVAAQVKGCATPPVIAYLWGLSDAAAANVTSSACSEPPGGVGDPGNTGAELQWCVLSTGVTIYAEKYTPAAQGWILVGVDTGTGSGGGTTGDEGGSALCATNPQGAAETVLGARRTNQRAKAQGCAPAEVLDQLFANTLDWSNVSVKSCESTQPQNPTADIQTASVCYLSNGFRFEVWQSTRPIQWYVARLNLPGV